MFTDVVVFHAKASYQFHLDRYGLAVGSHATVLKKGRIEVERGRIKSVDTSELTCTFASGTVFADNDAFDVLPVRNIECELCNHHCRRDELIRPACVNCDGRHMLCVDCVDKLDKCPYCNQ